MGDYSVHHHDCVSHDRHHRRRQPPIDLEIGNQSRQTLDDECVRKALAYGRGELEMVRDDEPTGSYDVSPDVYPAANSSRTKVRRAATVDRVEHRRKRRHHPPATGSSASTPRLEYEPPSETSVVCDLLSAAATVGDVTAIGTMTSPTDDVDDRVQRQADDNDWCECSNCHCQDKASRQTSGDDDRQSLTSQGGNQGIRSECKRCTGCAVVDRKCLSSTSFGSPVVCIAPTDVASSGSQQACASGPNPVSAEVQKVRLKVVYYHNRFVAIPVNSPPLLPPSSTSRTDTHSASSALSSSISDPTAAAAAAGCLPTSVVLPIILPSGSSLPGTAADTVTDHRSVSLDIRPLPNSSQDVAVGGVDASKSLRTQHLCRRQQQQPATMLRRIIKCLEDRDANAHDNEDDDDIDNGTSVKSKIGDKKRKRRRRRRRNADENRSAAFEAFVKTINVCFLMTGILLLLGVVAVIVYTSIGEFVNAYPIMIIISDVSHDLRLRSVVSNGILSLTCDPGARRHRPVAPYDTRGTPLCN